MRGFTLITNASKCFKLIWYFSVYKFRRDLLFTKQNHDPLNFHSILFWIYVCLTSFQFETWVLFVWKGHLMPVVHVCVCSVEIFLLSVTVEIQTLRTFQLFLAAHDGKIFSELYRNSSHYFTPTLCGSFFDGTVHWAMSGICRTHWGCG